MTLDEAIKRLRSSVEFQVVMKEAAALRPQLFPLDPKKPMDEQAARAMYVSGQLAGWELLEVFLTGRTKEK